MPRGSGSEVRSQPQSRSTSPERNQLTRNRLERSQSLQDLSSDRRCNNLFAQFNPDLLNLQSHGHPNNETIEINGNAAAPTENNIHNIINSSFSDSLAQTGSIGLSNEGRTEVQTQAQAENINRPDIQDGTIEEIIAQVKEGFQDTFDAHKAKILDTSREIPPHEIRQLLDEGQKLLKGSELILNDSLHTLPRMETKIDKIVNLNVQDEINAWKEAYPDTREPEPGSLHYDINVAKSKEVQLEDIVESLRRKKDKVNHKVNHAVQDLTSYTFPTAEDYNTLRSYIEKIDGNAVKMPLLEDVGNLQNKLKEAEFNETKEATQHFMQESAPTLIEKINKFIEIKALEWEFIATLNNLNLGQQKSESHPFFLRADMLDADARITVPPREYYPGRGLLHMATTIFSVEGIEVTREAQYHMKQILGIHPYGGGVSAEHLESRFAMLSSPTEYQFRKIEPQDLKIALSTGKPIGAFLDTSRVAVTSSGEGYYPERAVTLVRFERDDITQQDEVVVIDELRTAYDDPSKIAPYRIPVDIFAMRGWNGGVFLPKEASFEVHKTKISDTDRKLSPFEIRQLLDEGQKLWQDSMIISMESTNALAEACDKIDKLLVHCGLNKPLIK